MTTPYGQQPGGYGQQPGGYPQTPPGGYQQPQQPGGYPQSPAGGFQQPVYPQAPQYNPGSGGLPQAPPDYGQAGNAGIRPGTVTAAAVLAFVQAGITAITTIIMAAGGASQGADSDGAFIGWLLVLVQAAGVALLIIGGVQLISGKSRVLLIVGCAVELVICLFYIVIFSFLPTLGIAEAEMGKAILILTAVVLAVMPTISLILSAGGTATQFLRARRGY